MDAAPRASAIPRTVAWTGSHVRLIDQRALPSVLRTVDLGSCGEVVAAIRDMTVRGAPAIGCAAALGLVLAARAGCSQEPEAFGVALDGAARQLRGSRPTAVNLFWAIDRLMGVATRFATNPGEAADRMLAEALAMLDEDVRANEAIGRYGAELLPDGCSVLTHCNAGALATVAYGTALGVIRAAAAGRGLRHVFADETRPRLQGLKLTAWELMMEGIPVTAIPDGAAASLMRAGDVDCVVVGADRIAANGDAANKIGTYSVAVNASYHGIPFYVAAPLSTVDFAAPDGSAIPIEERDAAEVTHIDGHRVAPEDVSVWNPAFDVTPSRLITAIVTEVGVARPPFSRALREMSASAWGPSRT